MPFAFFQEHPVITLSALAFFINIPFGYFRENSLKFSLKWYFWIHASIPLIIYWRITLHETSAAIPINITLAVLGQSLGGVWRRRTLSQEDVENQQHIYLADRHSSLAVRRPTWDESDVSVVLLNMGGPRDMSEIRDFQMRLFSDPLLIRFPFSRVLQKFFARMLVVLRSRKVAARYQSIGGKSPVYESTTRQARTLAECLKKRGRRMAVVFCFNYSHPLPGEVVDGERKKGTRVILPLSLYPHYSKSTTGSSLHYLKQAAQKSSADVAFLPVPEYHLRDGYIAAFCDRILEQLKSGESLDDFYLIFSAHSLPFYLVAEGDPYPFQVSQTVGAILSRLQRTGAWSLAYQSSFGPLPWLRPSVPDIMKALARRGIKKMLIIPVSFVSDHLETLGDIDRDYRCLAGKLGVEDFRMSKAIESHPAFIEALADAVESAWPRG